MQPREGPVVARPPDTAQADPERDSDEAWRLLAGLPRQQRAVLVLRFYLDLSEAQIAETLGCSVGTVKSNASRGMAKLRAAVVATDAGTGRRVTVPVQQVSTADKASQYPATVDPGEPARIDIVRLDRCADQSEKERRYRDLAVVVLGREYPISALELTTACPLGVGSWRVLPPLLNVPFVVASIEAPAVVHRGQTLEYVVTLLNSGNRQYRLDPCPAFTQQFAGAVATHRLNCVVSRIGAHTSVRFQMAISVPSGAPPGRTKLTWRAVAADGHMITANLAEGGAYITVAE